MKTYKLLNVFTLVFLILISCEEEDEATAEITAVKSIEETTLENNEKSSRTISYTYNDSGYITKDDGYFPETYKYDSTGSILIEYDDSFFYNRKYTYNSKGQLESFYYKIIGFTYTYTYKYSSDGLLSEYDKDGKVYIITYKEGVVIYTYEEGNYKEVITLEYDILNKNYYSLLFPEAYLNIDSEMKYLINTKTTVKTPNYGVLNKQEKYTYTLNNQGYPTEIKIEYTETDTENVVTIDKTVTKKISYQ